MAISNGVFKGEISGKNIYDYSSKLDYGIDDLKKRKELVKEILNIDELGSRDEFWQEVWDMANCKVALNKSDSLWSETNVAALLEGIGTYLIAKDESECRKENRRFSRPKKETNISNDYSSENYDIVKNDKNYRLAPPDEVKNSDYKPRDIFSRDYNYYKDVLYPKYINKLKNRIIIDSENRYGYHDGIFEDFSCGGLIEENKWENLKRLEFEKIELLKEAKYNLDILKNQHSKRGEGTIYFRPYMNEIKNEYVDIYKYDFINRSTPCHKQLERSGYKNEDIKNIEDKFLYQKRTRSFGVNLSHIMNNLSDVNDYMLSCKMAYTNRVCIDPGKNNANMDIMEYVDYLNPKHIEAMLYLNGNEISYESDMSIISYDVTNIIRELRSLNEIDDKDLHIIEGIRHRVTQEKIGEELEMSKQAVNKRITKICNKITKFM